MIEILTGMQTHPHSFCKVLPKDDFDAILPKLQELKQQAKIEFGYTAYQFDTDSDPDTVCVECSAVPSVADDVARLIHGLPR